MSAFTLDTSGVVSIPSGPYAGDWTWETLPSDFLRGYLRAGFASFLAEELFAERAGWTWSVLQEGWVDGPEDLERDRTAREACRISCIEVDAPTFSDLHPDTLKVMMRDCAALCGEHDELRTDPEAGEHAWKSRQVGRWLNFPVQTLSLDDSGKIIIKAVA